MKQQEIAHSGEVSKIDSNTIYIIIKSHSACAGCHAKSACGMAEVKEKVVTVSCRNYPNIKVGDCVDVLISKKTGYFAITIAYLIPIVIVLLSLMLFEALGMNEILSATLMLAIIALYFVTIYILREKINRKINIRINL